MIKTYKGRRVDGEVVVAVETTPGPAHERKLNPRFDLRNHSPTGFEWGYGGSGPAQLALALCVDALDGYDDNADERAQKVYQSFKFAVVGHLKDGWKLTDVQVREAIEKLEARQNREG